MEECVFNEVQINCLVNSYHYMDSCVCVSVREYPLSNMLNLGYIVLHKEQTQNTVSDL